MKKEMFGRPLPSEGLTGLQKNILRLAHERFLGREDLCIEEVLLTLYGCRPARIGPLWAQNLSLGELVAVSRSEQHAEFHFRTEAEKESYELDQASAFEAVQNLAARGLVSEIRNPRVVWHTDKPVVRRIEYYQMIRLTEEGKKLLGEKRRHPRHPLRLPAECAGARQAFPDPGSVLDLSEEGLRLDLPTEFGVGQEVRLTLHLNGSIEILARIVWTQRRPGAAPSYRSGVRMIELSPENIRRVGRLLARVSPGAFSALSSARGNAFTC